MRLLPLFVMLVLGASAAAAARKGPEPSPSAQTLLAAPGQKQVQLDACNITPSRVPSMVLDVQKDVCTVTSRLLSSSGSGLQISFPCTANSDTRPNLSGPALNLWAALSEAGADTCTVTTLHPAIYYKRAAPAYYYGYKVGKLPCKQLDASAKTLALKSGNALAAPRTDGSRMGAQYGLWLVPELRSPAQGGAAAFSTDTQSCRLVVTTVGSSYLSKETFPCSLVENPEAKLGSGRCFGSDERGA